MRTATQAGVERQFPTMDGVSHHFVEVGGVRVHVAEAGAGDPVVLLHGFAQLVRVAPGHSLLAGHYRLLCPDLVGYGGSAAPRHGYGTAERVRWLLDLLDVFHPAQGATDRPRERRLFAVIRRTRPDHAQQF